MFNDQVRRWLPIACAVVTFIAGVRPSRLHRPWDIDEPIRLSETVYWRLFETGKFSDPLWRLPYETAHSPVMKYVYGVALELSGHRLPDDVRYYEFVSVHGHETSFPPELQPLFEPLKAPARVVSVAINSLTLGLVVLLGIQLGGVVAGIVAGAIVFRHFIFQSLLATVVSDPLETLLILLAGLASWLWWKRSDRDGARFGALAGLAAALAFHTRMNGLIAMGGCIAAAAAAPRLRLSRRLLFVASAGATFIVVAIAIWPLYWPLASPGGVGVASLPSAILGGLHLQLNSLNIELGKIPIWWRMNTVWECIVFSATSLTSGWAGKILGVGVVLFFLPGWTALWAGERTRFALCWAIPIVGVFVFWIPVWWFRYLLQILPEIALVAALGWAQAFRYVRDRAILGRHRSTFPAGLAPESSR